MGSLLPDKNDACFLGDVLGQEHLIVIGFKDYYQEQQVL